jgi:alkylhydroperoxidase/carboxymuconolactone decarboxylase family protein YurZ
MSDNSHIERYEHMLGILGELSYYLPDVLTHFDNVRLSTSGEGGALSPKAKDLIGLGIAIATRSDGWVEHFTHEAMQKNADRQEIIEVIGTAIAMRGGIVTKYGCIAYEAMDQFEARDRSYRTESNQTDDENS